MSHRISRRQLLQRSAAAAAAVGVSRFTALSYSQIAGSNSDIRIGVIGFNGRGISHIDAWRRIKGVRLTALCDADEKVLDKGLARAHETYTPATRPTTEPTTRATSRPSTLPTETADVPPPPEYVAKPGKIEKYRDLRKLLDDKEIDAISTATPNHWHALITVWGCQAGKDVYVEKPVSHEIWEGRKAVEAARKYNRIVQAGTQSRSFHPLAEAAKWVQAGHLGKIQVSRGLCYKRRQSIGKIEGEPTVPPSVDLNLWCGPSPLEKPHRKNFHYDWHWFWQTGNGDIGNQGIHQMDVARWMLGKDDLAPSVLSIGGRFGYEDDGQTPNTMFAVHNYGDSLLIFEVRGLPVHPKSPNMDKLKGETVGVLVECEEGYLRISANVEEAVAFDNDGKEIKRFEAARGTHGERKHFENFIHAVRSRKVSDLNADIEKGHVSSALCHTSNISYRLGKAADPEAIDSAVKSDPAASETFARFKDHLAKNEVDLDMTRATLGMPLKMDPKAERFIDNDSANRMLKREYRAPFVVPDEV